MRDWGQQRASGAQPPRITPASSLQRPQRAQPTCSIRVYLRADVAREGTIADHVCHARARHWHIAEGCFVVEEEVGTHYYPLTSVARWTIERP